MAVKWLINVAAKSIYEHRGHFAENLALQVKYHGGMSKQRFC